MQILLGFHSIDGSTGIVSDLKRVDLVFPTYGSTNVEHDKLKQVAIYCFPETGSLSVLMFLCGDVCFPVVKQ
jgi:hypothetical protein